MPLKSVISFFILTITASAQPGPPTDWTEGYVNANGIRIHYWRTGGDKPPLIMAHGSSDDGLCWTAIARELSGRYDVILPDARGHGLSDPRKRSDNADVQVEDLAGIIKGLKLSKPTIVGHSMGSSSAAWFASRYSDIPQALVLVDPRLVSRPPSENANRSSAIAAEKRAASILAKNNTSYEDLFDAQLKKFPHWGFTELHFWVLSKQRHHPSTAYSYASTDRPKMEDLFATITCPTLILKADDQGELRDRNQAVTRILKEGVIVHVKGAGHSVHRDQKALFLSELNAFLDRVSK